MKVSLIENSDVEDLVSLVGNHIGEVEAHMPFEADVVRHYAKWFATHPQGRAMFVCRNDEGELVGYIVCNTTPYFFCRGLSAGMDAVFVRKQSRGSTAFLRLVRAYEEWAKKEGAIEAYMGVDHGVDVERVGKTFSKVGFSFVGTFFRKVFK